MADEVNLIVERYKKRQILIGTGRYSMLNAPVWRAVLERQQALIKLLASKLHNGTEDIKVLEIGCGSGSNLVELIRFGFVPANLSGNELLPERLDRARQNLPDGVTLYGGDASQLPIINESLDVVYQSTVFSSILNDEFQTKLAEKMWNWIKPGGAILWYDFLYNNPSNPDVRGVTRKRIRQLFPEGKSVIVKVTLAPPINRRVTKIHSVMYPLFNMLPFLRTHVLCWIEKPF